MIWAGVLGILLLIVINGDIMFTVLSNTEPAILSRLFLSGCRHLSVTLAHRPVFNKRRALVSRAGPLIVVGLLVFWNLGLWVAYALLFNLTSDTVFHVSTGAPGNLVDTIYVAGYGLFSLGVGDIAPSPGAYQLILVAACMNGVLVASMTVAYSMSVVTSFNTGASVAARIASLGSTPAEIIATFWDGQHWDRQAFVTALQLTMHHMMPLLPTMRSSPLIFSFFTPSRAASMSVMISVLSETLMLLEHGVNAKRLPDAMPLVPRSMSTMFERTLLMFFDNTGRVGIPMQNISEETLAQLDVLQAPPLALLTAVGLPAVEPEQYAAVLLQPHLRRKRRTLLQLVDASGWLWEEVFPSAVSPVDARTTGGHAADSATPPPNGRRLAA